VAVSTSGKSPALARRIRVDLEEYFGDEYAALVEIVEEVRSELKSRGAAVSAGAWEEALDLGALLELLRGGNRNGARDRLMKALMEAQR
jgi:precorrin-2 dehydrogenase/sirohydrochlorin ferrochelatase